MGHREFIWSRYCTSNFFVRLEGFVSYKREAVEEVNDELVEGLRNKTSALKSVRKCMRRFIFCDEVKENLLDNCSINQSPLIFLWPSARTKLSSNIIWMKFALPVM